MGINNTLASKREKAEKLVKDIQSELNSITSLNDEAKRIVSEISSGNKEYQKVNRSLNSILKTTETSIEKFKEEKNRISYLLRQANSFYDKQYLPLKNQIISPNNGFKVKIKESQNLLNKLRNVEAQCEKKFDEVNVIITNFKKTVRELRTIETSIKKLHTSSVSNKNKSDSKLAEIINLEKRSKLLNNSIVELEVESKNLYNSIVELEENSNNKLKALEENHNVSEETLEKIKEIYDIAAETGRSGEFENRRNNLKNEVKKWEKYVIGVSITLLFLIVGLFVFQLKLLEWKLSSLEVNFYLRFILLSPVVYYLIFCVNQHNKKTKLYDKYSFKTTLAMSIKHHIELLVKQEHFSQHGQIDKVLDFVLDAFNKIYSEPYKDDDYKMKIKLANIELELEKKIYEIIKQSGK